MQRQRILRRGYHPIPWGSLTLGEFAIGGAESLSSAFGSRGAQTRSSL
jgi:hypothetical protein